MNAQVAGKDPGMYPRMRAGDADRERVVADQRHTGLGRLTLDESAARADAHRASPSAKLAALTSDLPTSPTAARRAPPRRPLAAAIAGMLLGADVAARTSRLTVTAAKNGVPVPDLQPYLGAYGHLVALRAGDLGYLHVHPQGSPGDGATAGPAIVFDVEVRTAGAYRLFLDFQHNGVVRTAPVTAPAA